MLTPVILCGGVGSRLWPLSRVSYPKQFLRIEGEQSLFQKTCMRVSDRRKFTAPIVVCNEEHRFRIAEHLNQIGIKDAKIVLESKPRNTAPAIALAANIMLSENSDNSMLVLPSDHVVSGNGTFSGAIDKAHRLAEEGHLVTFGIKPDKPATGFGYIKPGKPLAGGFIIESFTEKPSQAKAKLFIKDGCLWNSGMFLFKPKNFIFELEKFAPKISKKCKQAIDGAQKDLDFIRVDAENFDRCPSESIDYAIMEKTDKATVVKLKIGWNDIGNWSALWDATSKDKNNNSLIGDVIAQDTNDSYLRSENKLLVTLGLKEAIVVDTKDATLIASKKHAEQVKEIVDKIKKLKRTEHLNHSKEYRPWGNFESLDSDNNFQVKRITVDPGGRLSLQKHKKRSEHWVVVKGKAKVVRGEEDFILNKGESTFIPRNTKHSLENIGKDILEIVEVQTGDYLGEDDIIRYNDAYGRQKN